MPPCESTSVVPLADVPPSGPLRGNANPAVTPPVALSSSTWPAEWPISERPTGRKPAPPPPGSGGEDSPAPKMLHLPSTVTIDA